MSRSAGAAAKLPGSERKKLAVQALAGSEPISELSARLGVSRKFIYAQKDKASDALHDAFCSAVADDEVLFQLPVTRTWLRQVMVGLPLICRSSYRGVVEFMRDLLGVTVGVGSVHEVLRGAAQQAGAINREQDLSGIRVGLHDELFQGATPVLAGVDAQSTYCYLLAAERHRDADTWGVHLLDASRQGLAPDYTIADAGQGLRSGQKAAWGDTPCHGDVFHILHQCEKLANTLGNLARGARTRREKLEAKVGKACSRKRDGSFAAGLKRTRQAEVQAPQLARDIRTLTQWLSHDILALAGPVLATRQMLFDFVVDELQRREFLDPRRIRPVRVALQNQRDDLLAFAGVLDVKLAGIAGRGRARRSGARRVRAAPKTHDLARVLAGLGAVTISTGRSVPGRLRGRGAGHATHAAQQFAGGESQLAAAQLLHAAPSSGHPVPRPAALLPEPSALRTQPPG